MSGIGELVVLVDGSNVARCAAWVAHVGSDRADHELRRALVDAVASWTATAHVVDRTVVVFDGAGPWRAGETSVGSAVIVAGSGTRSGDDLVEAHAARLARAGARWWVVSSDRLLQSVAGARAERSIGADDFVVELTAARGESPAPAPPAPTDPGIAGLVGDDVRARLERMRRGH